MDQESVKKHFDNIAHLYDKYKSWNPYYHKLIEKIYIKIIPPKQKVLEIGCATGDLLNILKPEFGVGIDISSKMIEIAKKKYPSLNFINSSYEDFKTNDKFDYIILSNLLEHIYDINKLFQKINSFCNPDAKIIITTPNPLWEPVYRFSSRIKLKAPDTIRNFVSIRDIENLLELNKLQVIRKGFTGILPKKIPIVSNTINFLASNLPLLKNLGSIEYIVARKIREYKEYSVSIIVPCFNEEDNIKKCAQTIQKIGTKTELIFVDDGSTDNTSEVVKEVIASNINPNVTIRLISYKPNRGKWFAVKSGFDGATGDILMILDADMAVMPQELQNFYNAMANGSTEFINGTRYIYPMAEKSMKIANYFGNKMFAYLVSWIIGQRISDTLCGTKVLFKKDFSNITMGRDPWGDFDLLFGAAKLNLKINEIPVHYQKRVAGKSKMKAIKHTISLLKICWIGFKELKL